MTQLTVPTDVMNTLKQLAKSLHYQITEQLDPTVLQFVPQFGYQNYDLGVDYDDGTHGILVEFNEDHNHYNNGIYLLHKMKDGNLVMEVIKPNDKNKGDLILRHVDQIDRQVTGMDLIDMEVFDKNEMWGYVLADTVVKPLAKQLYPKDADKDKRIRFTMLYMPRMLANIARMYAGDESIREEAINSEPYLLKMMIDQGTAPKTAARDKRDEDQNASKAKTTTANDDDKHGSRADANKQASSKPDDASSKKGV